MADRFSVRGEAADSVAEYIKYREIVGNADGGRLLTDEEYMVSSVVATHHHHYDRLHARSTSFVLPSFDRCISMIVLPACGTLVYMYI